jgi:branched-chain amino acid transport system permease protein
MTVAQIIVGAVTVGSVYALVAAGLGIGYRPTNMFNLAQGAIFTMAAMTSATLAAQGWNWYLAAAAGLAASAAVAALCCGTAILPILRRPGQSSMWIISTLAFSIIAENVYTKIWVDEPRPMAPPPGLTTRSLAGNEMGISSYDIALVAVAVLVVLLAEAAYTTRVGHAALAVFEDRESATLKGINIYSISAGSVILGGAIAGLAGVLSAPLFSASLHAGFPVLVSAFAASVIGGLGSLRGALVGGLVVGLVETAATRLLSPGYQVTATLVLLIVALAIRPQGLIAPTKLRTV